MNEYENKFKSGDEVRVKSSSAVPVRGGCTTGTIDGTGTLGNRTHYFVDFGNGNGNWFPEEDLELVPHPDTARLDFLISKGESAFKQNEVGDWAVFDPHSHSQLVDAKWSGFGNSPRAAIDAAMKLSE